jgi:hypothetical protein
VCEGFRLTSPLDGMPNGVATFYWDPVRAEGVTYQVTIMDETRRLLAIYFAQGGTTVDGDVSTAVIGGGFQLVVQVAAMQNGQTICTDEHVILRAAPEGGAPPPDAPTPTPGRVSN